MSLPPESQSPEPMPATLNSLQTWLQTYIVDPASDDEVEAREAETASRLIRPSWSMSPIERANAYRGQYLMRMEEALAADFPALKHFMGDHDFWHFVEAYVQVHPSVGPNLSRLSDHVPEFFERCTLFKRPGFLYDMARLEQAICDVFESPLSSTLQQSDVARVPETAWPQARLNPITAFRMLALSYPVNAYLNAMKAGEPLPSTARQPNHMVVWRRHYTMWRMPLGVGEYNLLKDLVEGVKLGEALYRATKGRHRMDSQQVFACFARWVSEGMFAEVVLPEADAPGAHADGERNAHI